MSWYDMLKTQIWDHNPLFPPPSDPMVRLAMDVPGGRVVFPEIDPDRTAETMRMVTEMFGPKTRGEAGALGHLMAVLDDLEERSALHEQVQVVRDAVADWYAEHEAADHTDHTDHVHVSPNVVAEAPENWVEAEDILSEGVADLELAGWFPAFMSGEGIYTWSGAVDRVEVTVQ